MANVRIEIEEGEDPNEVKERLIKAFRQQLEAGPEHNEAFHQASAQEVFNLIIAEFEAAQIAAMKEIDEVLKEVL